MPLPVVLPGLAKVAFRALGAVAGGPASKPKRRRKAKLTQSDIMELSQIKNVLGKTAAANALPFYLGRR